MSRPHSLLERRWQDDRFPFQTEAHLLCMPGRVHKRIKEANCRRTQHHRISPLIYRRGSGKAQLRNAGRVQICEECLTKALTSGRLGWMSDKSAKLWTAMRSALLDCYSAMSEGDAKH